MATNRHRRKPASSSVFEVENLESRELLTFMGVGTPVGETAGILIIEGNNTNDDLRISLDTKNNSNPYDDQIVVRLTHDGVTEQQQFNLYEGYGANRHLHINSISYVGLGGQDRVTNLTNLNINAAEFHVGDQEHVMAFYSDPLTGQFHLHGSDQADTAEVHIGGLNNMYVTGKISYGNSSLEMTAKRYGIDANGAHPLQEIVFHGHRGDDSFTNNTDVRCVAYGEQGNDTLIGGSANDSLFGDSDYNYHWLYVGAGDDIIDGRGGDDFVFGGNGHDVIHGGDGNDELDGGFGDDSLFGDNDNDRVYGHAGNDHVEGGEGNDKLWGDNWCESDTSDDGDDWIYGGNGDDIIRGGAGDDTVLGGAGNDCIFGRMGDDLLIGGSGDDYIYGEAGSDIIYGGLGNDWLYGDTDGPELYVCDDILYGGDGNDELDGGNGNNQMTQDGPNYPQIKKFDVLTAYFSLIGAKKMKRSLR